MEERTDLPGGDAAEQAILPIHLHPGWGTVGPDRGDGTGFHFEAKVW